MRLLSILQDRSPDCISIARSKFATIWLNEEWYNEKRGLDGHYTISLENILTTYLSKLDQKDKSLSTFLSTLPEIPDSCLDTLQTLCEDPEYLILGLLTLRDLAENRPPIREQALGRLLEICTHSDRKIRVMGINTVKRWVPDSPMSERVTTFAIGLLRRLLEAKREITNGEGDGDGSLNAGGDVKMEVENVQNTEPAPSISTRWLKVVSPDSVGQHVELLFALSRRSQNLLDEIFVIYPKLPSDIQESLETLLVPLIQSIGASSKLLTLIRTFPPGAEKLSLRVLRILSEEGNTKVIGGLVKGLMKERVDLDPRFVIPIIGELDKEEIKTQLPRIVGLLADSENRETVRTAFAGVLQKLTPAELLVLLHQEEGETGLKPTIEGWSSSPYFTYHFFAHARSVAPQDGRDVTS